MKSSELVMVALAGGKELGSLAVVGGRTRHHRHEAFRCQGGPDH